jgi:cytochrome c oxidase cbb3-type subunit IV
MPEAYGWILSLWQLWLVVMFVAIVAWAFWPKNKRRFEGHGEIPLRNDDDRGP